MAIRYRRILAYCEEKEERLQKLQDYDSYLAQLQKELKQRRQELEVAAEQLSSERKAQALQLAKSD